VVDFFIYDDIVHKIQKNTFQLKRKLAKIHHGKIRLAFDLKIILSK